MFSEDDRKEILKKIDNALSIGYVAMGKNVQEFEEKFATYMRSKYAIAVSSAGEVYDIPLHEQPIFKEMNYGDFPMADDVCRRQICLPLYFSMTEEETTFVVKTLKYSITKQ